MTTRPAPQPVASAPYWGAALRRSAAAEYCGHSPNHFDKLVKEGIYPPGRLAGGVTVWLRWELDSALSNLPVAGASAPANSCDGAFGC